MEPYRLISTNTISLGKSAVKALLSPAYSKLSSVPKVATEEDAVKVLNVVNMSAFFLRVQRGGPSGTSSSSPKNLQVIAEQKFETTEYYAWFYEGSQWTTYAGGIAMVAIMLAGVMFPLWPPIMRLGVWYLSIAMLGLIGLFFAIAIFRLIFYIITIVVASPGIWIFPNLFADVGFVGYVIIHKVRHSYLLIRLIRSSLCGNGIFQRRNQRRVRRKRAKRRKRRKFRKILRKNTHEMEHLLRKYRRTRQR